MNFGACQGDVTPAPEDCTTPVDEDCDGIAPSCDEMQWSRQLPVSFLATTKNSALDASSNVFITGAMQEAADFGGGLITSAGGSDVFILKLDAAGNHLWSKRFGDVEEQRGQAIAVDAFGNVLVAGSFNGSIDFSGNVLNAETAANTFLAKFDSSGNHIWSRHFSGSVSNPTSLAVDAAGNAVVVGFFTSSIDCGGAPMTTAGSGDLFIAKLNAAGDHLWSKRFGDPAPQWHIKCAIDSSGEVLIAGSFEGQVSFGGGSLTSAGDADLFVAKLSGSGDHVWSRRFGDSSMQRGYGIAVDGPGNITIAGTLVGSIDFGSGPMMSAGNEDAFIARFDAAGQHVWSKHFGDGGEQSGVDVAVDTSANVIMTGGFFGSIDFGSGPMVSAGDEDVYLAQFTANGEHLRSRRFGAGKQQTGQTIAIDGTGNAVMTGSFLGTIDFGDNQLVTQGGSAVFVAKLPP
jgi:DNA-binding beta-propeller fold protein YncE